MLVVVLTDKIAVLQGSGADETGRAQQYPPLLWGNDDRRRLLPDISLV